MKTRKCDKCQQDIEGPFIKCCRSEIINKIQKLVYVGDLCPTCWEKVIEK